MLLNESIFVIILLLMVLKLLTSSKLNLYLDVLDKRSDNFHNIQSLFLEVSLGDKISFEKIIGYNEIIINTNIKDIEHKDNIIFKIWEKTKTFLDGKSGLQVDLEKIIPLGSGLGGGSADGVYSLYAIENLFGLTLNYDEKFKICSELGSDLPFFINGGLQIVAGRGEQLKMVCERAMENAENPIKSKFLIICPDIFISTADAYRGLNITPLSESIINEKKHLNISRINSLIEGILSNNPSLIYKNLYNKFEDYVFSMTPDLKKIKERLIELGAIGSLMSGSGSSIFGIFFDDDLLENAFKKMTEEQYKCFKALPKIKMP